MNWDKQLNKNIVHECQIRAMFYNVKRHWAGVDIGEIIRQSFLKK